MPKFDASMIGDVEYDFTDWKGIRGSVYEGRSIEDSGVVPEPSSDLVSKTMSKVTAAFNRMNITDDDGNPIDENDVKAIAEAMRKVNDQQTFAQMASELMDAVADLCDGSPRRESLEALGWRKFMAFTGYLMGELMSPEVSKNATGNTPTRLRSV